ncbi:MAG: cell division protein FtsW [Alphaproteobacteria bacterium]|nr:cell division protein FtsW [Alphaproteobacteria bacterium]MCB9928922.1 cell division protein FtsW [Alphaproteobacteria bacterium]
MTPFARTDRSIVGRWWWTVDRWTLAALLSLIGIGVVLIVSGSPGVSDTIGYDPFHFVRRHLVYAPLAVMILVSASLLGPREVRWCAAGLVALTLLLLVMVLLVGVEAKGARRWVSLAGLTLQPSEFMKPALAVAGAWLFALFQQTKQWRYLLANIALLVVTVLLMVSQPDIGMTVVIVTVWMAQFFLAGLPVAATAALGSLGLAGFVFAYFTFDHVQSRIDRFLNPAAGDTYQIDKSIAAFESGGWFGVGPGNGALKTQLPDAHADFVLAVAGEEFGAALCLVLVALIAVVVFRGLLRVAHTRSLFVSVAAAGLLVSFAMQAMINMASALELIPAKGMTLPFVSYGGSSMLAVAVSMGFLLALTRRRIGYEPEDRV